LEEFSLVDIVIKRAEEESRKSISRVIAYAFQKDFKALVNNMDKVAMAIESGIQIGRFFVAEQNGIIIGVIACTDCTGRAVIVNCADYKKHFGFIRGLIATKILTEEFMAPLQYPSNIGYIEFVAVNENVRGNGIAKKMLQGVIEETAYESYILDVTDINTYAIRCYQSFGFVEIDKVPVKHAKQKGFNSKIYMQYDRK